VGVHTPEFDFERQRDNVSQAVKDAGILYPVVLDNEYGTWTNYCNHFWPRKYLIDIYGNIVYDHAGEYHYDETERKIQELLQERMNVFHLQGDVARDTVSPTGTMTVDISQLGSPETYFGSKRNEFLTNGTSGTVGLQTLTMPRTTEQNALYLDGSWNFQQEFAENASSKAKIVFRYKAKSVYFVASSDAPVTVTVLRDGKPLSSERGVDVVESNGSTHTTIQADRLYKLIDDPVGYAEHTLELIIENPGLRAFTFTFG
jgi:hypothetical protein